MPIVFNTNALLRPPFTAAEFTATKWESADIKAKFASGLCHFIAADFKESLFTQPLYRRLVLSFGHVGHCDKFGFYDHFFRDLRGKVDFLEQTLTWQPCGQPEYTYCDVEHAVLARLRKCNLLAAYRALLAAEVEGAERELLRRLRTKYEGAGEPAPPPILHSGHPAKRERKSQPPEQAGLF